MRKKRFTPAARSGRFTAFGTLALLATIATACADANPQAPEQIDEGVGGRATDEWEGDVDVDVIPDIPPEPIVGCGEQLMAPQTYLCAGSVHEETQVDATAMQLYATSGNYACRAEPIYYYLDDGYDYATGGAAATAYPDDDYPGYGAESGYGAEQGFGGDSGYGAENGLGGDDGWGMGGVGGYGAGGSFYEPPLVEPLSDWCDDLPYNTRIAGASFGTRECQASELRTPITFVEPQGDWYELKVFGGDSPCERGELLAETAGYGQGEVRQIEIDASNLAFVSLQYTGDNGWNMVEIALDSTLAPVTTESPE